MGKNDIPQKQRTLLEGLLLWGDQSLLRAIRDEEQDIMNFALAEFHHPRLGSDEGLAAAKLPFAKMDLSALSRLWGDIIRHFSHEMERLDLVLTGVPFRDPPDLERVRIPTAYSVEFGFDFKKNILTVGSVRYFSVAVTENASYPATQGTSSVNANWGGTLTIADLTDDQILELLNEHIRRVTESPEPKMMARVKDSLQPIIFRRMEFRATNCELATTLSQEAKAIQTWITEVAPWHHKPALKTVENNIREKYAALKPRSIPPISRS